MRMGERCRAELVPRRDGRDVRLSRAHAPDALQQDVVELIDFARRHPRLFVLTGAGVSTESGIPAYRDDTGTWMRSAPITGPEFTRSSSARRRYWARSMAGWPAIEHARPNAAHEAIARLEATGRVSRLVTQNVDGLHQMAGSRDVLELHGTLRRVVCLDCGTMHERGAVQCALVQENTEPDVASRAMPDGDSDVDLSAAAMQDFVVPRCRACGGTLKPDVVFFGENVPRARVEAAMDALEASDAMLVVGTSLAVYSGFRFCERAVATGKPIAAINRGRTRADHLLALKVERLCTAALTELAEGLGCA